MSVTRRALLLLASATLGAFASIASAQTPEEFYAGKTVTILIPSGPGGTYAQYGNIVGEFFTKHMVGNPSVVFEFIPSGIESMNYFYNVAPKDGSWIAIYSQNSAISQVLEPELVQFDVTKFQALGLVAQLNAVLTVREASPIQSVEDLKEKELILGATETTSYQYRIPIAMNHYLGTKIKVITGYSDVPEVNLAMERGEVDGTFTSWLAAKQARSETDANNPPVRYLFQVGINSEPDLDAPLLQEFVTDEKARQAFNFHASFTALSRGFIAPPGVPEDRVAALREAIAAVIADPEFKAKLEENKLPLRPLTWEEQQAVMNEAASTPRELVAFE
jgi:tripartite-type tricarboxylate transporter receptor subunit TctC